MAATFLLTHGSSQWNQSRGCISLLHIAESSFLKISHICHCQLEEHVLIVQTPEKNLEETGSAVNKGYHPAGGAEPIAVSKISPF